MTRILYRIVSWIDGVWHVYVCNLVERLYVKAGLDEYHDEDSHLPE